MSLVLLPLRFVLGLIFAVHGYLKLFAARLGPAKFARYLADEGLPFPRPLAYGIGLLELLGGVLLLVGLYGRVAAAALAVHVFLALITVGPKKGFTRLPEAGYEYELLLLAGLLTLLSTAGTPYSLDAYLGR